MDVFTAGEWRVKPGRDAEFVEAWQEMSDWLLVQFAEGGWAKLLHDRDDAALYLSVGEWPDDRAIVEARASEGFRQRTASLRQLADSKMMTMDEAASSGHIASVAGVSR